MAAAAARTRPAAGQLLRPQGELAALRAYLRQRERLLDYAASPIQPMQKALAQMNVQLHHAVTGITGMTGMRIIRAIVAGEQRDPAALAAHRDHRCHASTAALRDALTGNWREGHLFALGQALDLYDRYQEKVAGCDVRIEAVLGRLSSATDKSGGGLPPARQRCGTAHAPAFDARAALHALLGVDLTQIHGLGPSLALKLVGECGTDCMAERQALHLLTLPRAEQQDLRRQGALVPHPTFRQPGCVAAAARRGDRRAHPDRAGRFLSPPGGTRRKLAALFYNTLRHGMAYADPGASYYEQRYRARVLANLQLRAKSLGYVLQEAPPAPA